MNVLHTEWLGRISYEEGLLLQDRWVKTALATGNECLLLLEHNPVFTIGRTLDESSLLNSAQLPFPVHRTNRGGQATYHGPGQLVCYPILNLARRGRDLHKYLRFLEEVVLEILNEYNIQGRRRESLTGVWVEDRKIASIGVGVRHWIAMHGFALNIAQDLSGFSNIIPCGIPGVSMTSLSAEIHRDLTPYEVGEVAKAIFFRLLQNLPSGCF